MVRLKIAKVFAGNNFTPAHPGAILVYDITDEDSFHKVEILINVIFCSDEDNWPSISS